MKFSEMPYARPDTETVKKHWHSSRRSEKH